MDMTMEAQADVWAETGCLRSSGYSLDLEVCMSDGATEALVQWQCWENSRTWSHTDGRQGHPGCHSVGLKFPKTRLTCFVLSSIFESETEQRELHQSQFLAIQRCLSLFFEARIVVQYRDERKWKESASQWTLGWGNMISWVVTYYNSSPNFMLKVASRKQGHQSRFIYAYLCENFGRWYIVNLH